MNRFSMFLLIKGTVNKSKFLRNIAFIYGGDF